MNGSTSTWTVTRSLSSATTLSIAGLLDKQIPVRQVTCRRRPSTMWFDDECRRAKRVLRSMETAARRTGPLSDNNLPAVAAWRVQRRQYFTLLQQKHSDFWTKRLHGRRAVTTASTLAVVRWAAWSRPSTSVIRHWCFYTACIASSTIRSLAFVHPPMAVIHVPTFTTVPVGCELRLFTPVSSADVVELVKKMSDKQCTRDPLPTWLLKQSVEVLAPFLCRLFNWSIQSATVPSTFKFAYITQLLKKADLDAADAKSYRPISNLSQKKLFR